MKTRRIEALWTRFAGLRNGGLRFDQRRDQRSAPSLREKFFPDGAGEKMI